MPSEIEQQRNALLKSKEEFDQLSGEVLHGRTVEKEKVLYPAWPDVAPKMEQWLKEDAEPVLAKAGANRGHGEGAAGPGVGDRSGGRSGAGRSIRPTGSWRRPVAHVEVFAAGAGGCT